MNTVGKKFCILQLLKKSKNLTDISKSSTIKIFEIIKEKIIVGVY